MNFFKKAKKTFSKAVALTLAVMMLPLSPLVPATPAHAEVNTGYNATGEKAQEGKFILDLKGAMVLPTQVKMVIERKSSRVQL